MKRKIIFTLYSLVLIVFVFQNTVYAYIDPGSVSAVIQAIAASVLVGGAAIGIFFNRIKNALSRKKTNEQTNLPDELNKDD